MSGSEDLSGGWQGIFNYPPGHPPNVFTATLQDNGSLLTGETSEPSDDPFDRDAIQHGWLEGRREGTAVTFVKSYDDPGRADYVVHYAGSVAPDGSEITGTWDIPGVWSGTFIMTRDTGKAEEIGREVAQTVR